MKDSTPKRVSLFFGHVASNIGDLAINSGTIELIKELIPSCKINVILINAKKSQFLDFAKPSFGCTGETYFNHININIGLIKRCLTQPKHILTELGIEDTQLLLLASGEHFFRYESGENSESLFWRLLPVVASHHAKIPCVLLPSTLGPFEGGISQQLPHALLNLTQANAARDLHSKKVVESFPNLGEIPLCADPAFFVKCPKNSTFGKNVTGLVLRSEGWGIRLDKGTRTKFAAKFKGEAYTLTKAYKVGIALAQKILLDPEARIKLFVQTTADQQLANSIFENLSSNGLGDRVEISRPNSIQEYLEQMSVMTRVIASRFHALVLGMVVKKPIYGLYFDSHGHKIPGLFEMLEKSTHCFQMSQFNSDIISTRLVDSFIDETSYSKDLKTKLNELKKQTKNWLKKALACDFKAVSREDLDLANATLINYGFEHAEALSKKSNDVEKSALEKDAKSKISNYKKENYNFKKLLDQTKSDLNLKILECSALTKKELKAENSLRDSQVKGSLTEIKLKTSEKELINKKKELEAIEKKYLNLKKESESLHQNHVNLNKSLEDSEKKFLNLKKESESLHLNHVNLNKSLECANAHINKLELSLNDSEKKLKESQDDFENLVIRFELNSKILSEKNKLNICNAEVIRKLDSDLRKKGNLIKEKDNTLKFIKNDLLNSRIEYSKVKFFLSFYLETISGIIDSKTSLTKAIKLTPEYKLGAEILAEYNRHPSLPRLIRFILKSYKRLKNSLIAPSADYHDTLQKTYNAVKGGDLSAFEDSLLISFAGPDEQAGFYTELSRKLKTVNAKAACKSAELAYLSDPKHFRAKWWSFRLAEANEVVKAYAILEHLPKGTPFSDSEIRRAEEINTKAYSTLKEMVPPSKGTTSSFDSIDDIVTLEALYNSGGIDLIIKEISKKSYRSKKAHSQDLLKCGKLLYENGHEDAEIDLAHKALAIDDSPQVMRLFAYAAERAGRIEESCKAIVQFESYCEAHPNDATSKQLRQLKKLHSYQLNTLSKIKERETTTYSPVQGRICYVLHNSLPYASGGYATRSHGVATGLVSNGMDVICLTRPGFPIDTIDVPQSEVQNVDIIDGVSYRRVLSPLRKGIGTGAYMLEIVDILEKQFKEIKPSLVWGASFYLSALPALIAARKVGIPFVYEVRGLAELTALSRHKGYKDTTAYKVQETMETRTAHSADLVYTLTKGMADLMAGRGIPESKIKIIPNSCNVERFKPAGKDLTLAEELNIPVGVPVIGYIGTFVDYEGLEDLAKACTFLYKEGLEFRLLLVGSENTAKKDKGPIANKIHTIALEGGYSKWLRMPGRVAHKVIENYYSLIDICPFPRKALPVCELVSPMKPLEAMALQKTVVVSSVRALSEMVEHEKTGYIFEKDNVKELSTVLKKAIENQHKGKALGQSARKWVKEKRSWHKVINNAIKELNNLTVEL